jgi:regulator of cell morphogenesis and NO signaling
MISRESPMYRVVLENLQLLPLLPRFNLRSGFGEKSVDEVCCAHGVNTDFFLEIANAYLDELYVPEEGLSLFSLGTMVNYIKSTHSYYTDIALPMVEEKIYQLVERSSLSEKEVRLVTNFFNDYKKDFMTHISQEEEQILPYILDLERQSSLEKPDPPFIQKLQTYSISEFEKEHDRLEISLKHLSELIIKYLPPFDDLQLCHQVLNDLSRLMKDLVDHADMEDKVLIPRVAELERELLNRVSLT